MTEVIKFSAEIKSGVGRGAARTLRREGKLPAVVYGGSEAPEMVALSVNEFIKEYQKGGIKTRPVELRAGTKTISAITKDIQINPVTDVPVHVDFLRVGKDTVVNVAVTIRVINEDKSPGVKKGGIANIVSRKIQFLCHPSNIPHHIEIDLAGLEIGHIVHINDIKLPEGVKPADSSNFTLLTIIGRTEEGEGKTGAEGAASTAEASAATSE
jgi:large subunit ribosomal protein L25